MLNLLKFKIFVLLALVFVVFANVNTASAIQTQSKSIWGPPSVNGVSQFPVYQDLGAGIYQMAVDWSSIAPIKPAKPTDPNDPAYVWPEWIGESNKEAGKYKMQTLMMVVGAPSWANGGHPAEERWAPVNPQDYANFMVAMSRKYPEIKYWMIWGEPNRSVQFKPLTPFRGVGPLNTEQAVAPKKYGLILDRAYGALKKVNKKDIVIGGNTYTAAGSDSISTYAWLRYMRLPNGKMPRLDMYGHNPFSFRKPNLANKPSPKGMVDFSDAVRLTRKIDIYYPRKRGKKIKLFFSEYGVPAGPGNDGELGFGLTYGQQSDWIRAAFKVKNNHKRIFTLGWIHPMDRPDHGITTGLLTADGKKKPGYYAFKYSR
jgi:hypothetical protein